MGIGRLQAGRFNLVLSIRHNADAARLDEWRASYQRASELLFDATDGQHQFGDVYVCNNSSGGRNADAWLLLEDGRSSSPVNGLGVETAHQTLFGDERFKPFIVIHEFGHYAYGVFDEYSGPTATAGLSCIGGTTSDACIMETGWSEGDRFGDNATGGALVLGRVSEFCVASNHDPDNDTFQSSINGEPCWRTMVDQFPGLILPTNTPVGAAPGGAGAINWIVLAPEQRFVLVIDRSGSMAGNKLTEARFGCDWWADNATIGDRLGVVSYADTATADYPAQAINSDTDRNNAQTTIAGLAAGGLTSIGDGLRTALNQILGLGQRAATQVVILLTDGLQNAGEHPNTVLPDLVANGVRVYTLGVGPDVDAGLLTNIANTTGGAFYRIDPVLPTDQQSFQIRTRLQEISGVARDNGGVVTAFPERAELGKTMERKVLIEEGSEAVTFAISWKNPRSLLLLELLAPDGRRITRSTPGPDVRPIFTHRPYMGFQVKSPLAGEWVLRILTEHVVGGAPEEFECFVFSQNRHIDGGLMASRHQYAPRDLIPLRLQMYFDQPLTGLVVQAVARAPGGSTIPLKFSDDGDKDAGDLIPGDGLYHATFRAPRRQGVYTIEATVISDGAAKYCESGEKLLPDEVFNHAPISKFVRQFTLALLVGEEQNPRIVIDPDRARVGDQLEVKITGRLTHFVSPLGGPGGTVATFGEGVRVTSLRVLNPEQAIASLVISRETSPGSREVIVSTPSRAEIVVAESGFRVLRGSPTPEPFEPPVPSERITQRGHIERLVYDGNANLVGLRLSEGSDLIHVSERFESVLKDVFQANLRVTLISNPTTREIEFLEIG